MRKQDIDRSLVLAGFALDCETTIPVTVSHWQIHSVDLARRG